MLIYAHSSLNLSIQLIIILFLFSLFSWTLFEYITHRYIFHYKAKGNIGKRLIYLFHGNHHEYPRDRKRLLMPSVSSVIIVIAAFSSFYICHTYLPELEYMPLPVFRDLLLGT